jgi:monofunctional biosynthetic peptidoglycan transglycosylase
MKRPKPRTSRKGFFATLLAGGLASFYGITLVLVMVLAVGGFYVWMTLPDVRILKAAYPVVKYLGADEPPLVSLQRARPSTWISLGEVSKLGVAAILISEDWAFFQHHGYDVNQIKEAAQEDWEEKGFVRGASTIDQQVVRNVFLTKDKNLWRKAKELYLAVKMDEVVSKKKVLETYLNIAEWGPGIFGIRAASDYYFNKAPSGLTAKEGAFLAMLLPSPIRYAQSFRQGKLTDYAYETVQSILQKMTQAHYLSEEERLAEMARPLSFERF